ncbi:PepSY-associated TM helix domain-containing protein [Sphingomonas sp. ASY06-1R]|uniref:PepSY-associated TM helix domain-containing protein n=1 Tax=Sphingomonas sp. ASY06-1R TaxID=3445771 RepID=UPI003FA221F2
MRWIEWLHRWLGGSIGLLLALIGLSGAILVHRDAWTMVAHKQDAVDRDAVHIAARVAQAMADPARRPEGIVFASPGFAVDRLTFSGGAGAYTDQTGRTLARWDSQWQRPELWLFDFHRHLFSGDRGETFVGIAGLAGIVFVATGTLLWWRTRRSFAFRLLPKRHSHPAFLRHHRDLGIVVAPLLLLSCVTGTVLVFRPLASILLGPGATAAMRQAAAPPKVDKMALAAKLDWAAMIRAAHDRFPDADIRVLNLPRGGSGLITLRMKQSDEWLPNGRTTIWFAADSGRIVDVRDATRLPAQVRAFGLLFPLHSAAVGGLAFRIVMTISGLALALLGSLAVWSFWFLRRTPRRPAPRPQTA